MQHRLPGGFCAGFGWDLGRVPIECVGPFATIVFVLVGSGQFTSATRYCKKKKKKRSFVLKKKKQSRQPIDCHFGNYVPVITSDTATVTPVEPGTVNETTTVLLLLLLLLLLSTAYYLVRYWHCCAYVPGMKISCVYIRRAVCCCCY